MREWEVGLGEGLRPPRPSRIGMMSVGTDKGRWISTRQKHPATPPLIPALPFPHTYLLHPPPPSLFSPLDTSFISSRFPPSPPRVLPSLSPHLPSFPYLFLFSPSTSSPTLPPKAPLRRLPHPSPPHLIHPSLLLFFPPYQHSSQGTHTGVQKDATPTPKDRGICNFIPGVINVASGVAGKEAGRDPIYDAGAPSLNLDCCLVFT